MDISNANFGNIDSGGGGVHIGNKINILEGITALSQEYKEQIQSIQNLLYQFKPNSALTLILELKKRIEESEIHDKDKVLSKILFLEGQCKNELNEYNREEVSKIFIQAYKLNPESKDLKKRACIEYRFLNNIPIATKLAEELLEKDDYDITAWYVKTSISKDLASYLKIVPEIIKKNINFQHSTIYDIIATKDIRSLEELESYNLEINIPPENYQELTFDNKGSWMIAINLLLNRVFNNSHIRYIAGDKVLLQKTPDIILAHELLLKFVSSLEKTEIENTITHQKFLYNYIEYLMSYKKEYAEKLESCYKDIKNKNWFYLSCLCQVLNNREEYQSSLNYLSEFESNGSNINFEFLTFKAAVSSFLNRVEDIKDCLNKYLNLITEIDEIQGFNIVNTFLGILYFKKISNEQLQILIDNFLQKKFKNENIKEILKITTIVRYGENYNEEEIFNRLEELKKDLTLHISLKDLIAENLNAIGYTNEAIDYMNSYLDKSTISPSLRLYILLLDSILHSKEEKTLTEYYKELLLLLEFWRVNNESVDSALLKIEHDLYYTINDWKKVNLIDEIFYNQFPNDDNYLYRYLMSLEKLKLHEKINGLAIKTKDFFENEGIGLIVCGVFLRNKNIEKGFKILYNLANNKSNFNARLNYFGTALKFESFLKNYSTIDIGYWVTYKVGDKIEKIKIENANSGLSKELLGKKVGDEFELKGRFNNKSHSVKILEITNDALNLLREISEEARNPLNDLGIHSLEIGPETNIIEFLKENFGETGNEEKKFTQQYLNEYYNFKIGFSEVIRLVFDEKYIEGYFYLTQTTGCKFNTLPISVTESINLSPTTTYSLDFSSLLLFYLLSKEHGFKFNHKFYISYYIKSHIEEEIDYINNSPESPLSVQITSTRVQKILTPENYKEKNIEFLNSILDWIDENCIIDLVPEKLNLALKIDFEESKEKFMKLLVDNMFLNNRSNHHHISSDVTLFYLSRKNNDLYCNIISPEKYLLEFLPDKANNDLYNFLLESNYLGININLEILKEHFYKLLAGSKNYYHSCLKNLQYYINPNTQNIDTICLFIKNIYLEVTLSIDDKNKYSEEILRNFIYGMQKDLLINLLNKLKEAFDLMGEYYNHMVMTFFEALKQHPA